MTAWMRKKEASLTAVLVYIAIVLSGVAAGLYGYVWNIIKLFEISDAGSHIGELIIRVIGVFTGIIGAIAGYF